MIAAHRAVLAFPDRTPAELESIIAPIVCTSERDQMRFRTAFETWFRASELKSAEAPVRLKEAVDERHVFIKRAIVRSTGLILLLALAAWLMRPLFQPEPNQETKQELKSKGEAPRRVPNGAQVPPVQPGKAIHVEPTPYFEIVSAQTTPKTKSRALWVWLLASLALVPTAGFIAWRRWIIHQGERLAGGDLEKARAPFHNLFQPRLRTGIYEDGGFTRIAAAMRRHRTEVSQRLDVPKTLRKTMDQGGYPRAVYASRKLSPEYLVLVDRRGYPDHLAWFLEEFLLRLQEEGVYIDWYEFEEDPRKVWRPNERRKRTQPVALSTLTSRYANHRLLIFGNASRLLDPASGALPRWSSVFRQWPCRAFFDSEPPSDWGRSEQMVQASGFEVFPADRTGLARFIEQLNHTRYSGDWLGRETPRLPNSLRPWAADTDAWEEEDEEDPSKEEQLAIVSGLRRYLGEVGYTWLCACAVPPALDWNVTLCLGQHLTDPHGEPLMTEDRLGALARLRWFRDGRLPEWLRPRLVNDLPESLVPKARHAFTYLLLQGSAKAPFDSYQINERTAATFEAKEAMSQLIEGAQPNSAAYDPTFASFLAGKPVTRERRPRERPVSRWKVMAIVGALGGFAIASAFFWGGVEHRGFLAKLLWWGGAFYAFAALVIALRSKPQLTFSS